jgi:hypothetical protein
MSEQMGNEQIEAGPEQAADLARLESMAREGEPDIGPDESGPGVVDPVEAVAGLLTVAGMGAGWFGYRRVSEVWGPESCRAVAEKAVPVLQKYPWGIAALDFLQTGAGVDEIALGMCILPMVIATMDAARADDEERAKKRREPETVEGEAVEVEP